MEDGWVSGCRSAPVTMLDLIGLTKSNVEGEGSTKKVRFEDGGMPTESIDNILRRKKQEVQKRKQTEEEEEPARDPAKRRRREERFGHVTAEGSEGLSTKNLLLNNILHQRLLKFGTLPEETKGREGVIASAETAKKEERLRRLGI
eukprot:TRINITY_DN7722_c0_g1_i1.p1 TRINITY_DN7722_c0_g1~~TRINITY_DN7722_c0_g1_i1.p1  ORF type:complete len:155 (+),score=30.98 TRINITY_DN7722_c0_g1_i1:28-465(+)